MRCGFLETPEQTFGAAATTAGAGRELSFRCRAKNEQIVPPYAEACGPEDVRHAEPAATMPFACVLLRGSETMLAGSIGRAELMGGDLLKLVA